MISANIVLYGNCWEYNNDHMMVEYMFMKSKRRHGPKNKFNDEEDTILTEAVCELGTTDWHKIAKRLPGRNARQCRERWNNYVNPVISTKPWTKEEDETLELKYTEYGPKWHTIATFFVNRPVNTIKNRWFAKVKKSQKDMENGPSKTSFVQPEPPAPYPSIDTILTSLPLHTKHLQFPDIPLA